jgi:lipocalin
MTSIPTDLVDVRLNSVSADRTLNIANNLEAMKTPIDIQQFMGRWFVQAHIPSFIDRDSVNNIEDYEWDEARQIIRVTFSYTPLKKDKSLGNEKVLKQHGKVMNAECTEWAVSIKFLVYWPLSTRYLILAVNEGESDLPARTADSSTLLNMKGDNKKHLYDSCLIGVPDRSLLWVMTRSNSQISQFQLEEYISISERLGYADVREKLKRVSIIPSGPTVSSPKDDVRSEMFYESFSEKENDSTSIRRAQPFAFVLPPLVGMNTPINVEKFMGRWYVHAHIPSMFDKGTVNNIEEYSWDQEKQKIGVIFKYRAVNKDGSLGSEKILQQSASILNTECTEWSMSIKLLVYWPLPLNYLLLAVNEGEGLNSEFKGTARDLVYSSAMVGVPDRSLLWIMTRSEEPITEYQLGVYINIAESLGYSDPRYDIQRVLQTSKNNISSILNAEGSFLEARGESVDV